MPFDPVSYALAKKALRRAKKAKSTSQGIKNLDPDWVGDLFLVKELVNAGKLTWDDFAYFIDNKLSVKFWVRRLNNGIDLLVETEDDWASVFNSANLSADRVASIIADAETAVSRLAKIFNSANLEADRGASIFSSANVSADRVAEILNDPNIAVSKCASILNSANISATRVKEIFESAKIEASRIHDILADSNFSADKIQTVLYGMVDDGVWDKLLDIVTASAPDSTISSDTTITGTNRYRNLTIDSGITLTVDGQPGVIIAYTITNNGSIVKTPTGGDGGAPGASPGAGGKGGGGLIIVAKSIKGGEYHADGGDGESGSTTSSTASGSAGSDGFMYAIGSDAPGDGGDGAGYYNGAGGSPGGGGGGGTSGSSAKAGAGGVITVDNAKYSDYIDLAKDILYAVVDYYITEVLGKTLSSAKSFINVYGAGGGGGADWDGTGDCGGGGGSGGELIAVAYEIDGGTFTANGGAGGNGGSEDTQDAEGGGGGGGIVYVLYKSVVTAPTVEANGGNPGTGDSPTRAATAGTAGTAKAVAV